MGNRWTEEDFAKMKKIADAFERHSNEFGMIQKNPKDPKLHAKVEEAFKDIEKTVKENPINRNFSPTEKEKQLFKNMQPIMNEMRKNTEKVMAELAAKKIEPFSEEGRKHFFISEKQGELMGKMLKDYEEASRNEQKAKKKFHFF